MPKKAFFIGPYKSGRINAVKPWLLPEDAFEFLDNAYVWRGRVKKRFGSRLFDNTAGVEYQQLNSRLRVKVDTTVAGAAAGTVPAGVTPAVGQMFSIGTSIYTVYQTGTPANMLITDGTAIATYDTTTGAYNFVGAPAAEDVYFYPALPVMGIVTYERINISDELTYAFDTVFAYKRESSGWNNLGLLTDVWSGSDSQFFWATNYLGTTNDDYWLFVVNNNQPDQIKYWDGAAGTWSTIAPATRSAGVYTLQTCRLIVSFKDRLIALNTTEEVNGAGTYYNFANRARWCQNGNPSAANAWHEDIPGLGGWIDAPTKEAIITARLLKDRLIVYFENSTWELVYTGNQILPFIWQNIDNELGAESTFSSIQFDKVVLGFGETGIHSCDGLLVKRIDNQIPDKVFQITNGSTGFERVAGVRDFFLEMAYWSFSDELKDTAKYPNKLLVYNYVNNSWSTADDSITAFGYYQNETDATWSSTKSTWATTGRTWASGITNLKYRNVLAGNQEGWTFVIDPTQHRNAPALQITNIDFTSSPVLQLTIIDHNLVEDEYVWIEYTNGTTDLNNKIGVVQSVIDKDTINIWINDGTLPAGTYTGGGTCARVSQVQLITKEFNFYGDAQKIAIEKVDFEVDSTQDNVFTASFFSSTGNYDLGADAVDDGIALGTYNLDTYPYDTIYPLEAYQTRLVHPVYLQAEGDCVQIGLTQNDEQLTNTDMAQQDFVLHSMTFYARSTGQRL
jgi:hypothetical protein